MLMGDRGGCFARRIGRGPARNEKGKKWEDIKKLEEKRNDIKKQNVIEQIKRRRQGGYDAGL